MKDNGETGMIQIYFRAVAACMVAIFFWPPFAMGQDGMAANFENTEIRFLISGSVGGGSDTQGRLLARYISKHLRGNPTIVPQNISGGGGIKMVKYFMGLETNTDLAIAMIQSALPFRSRSGVISEDDFDPREMQWIGSVSDSTIICLMSATANVVDLDALRSREFTFGAQSKTSQPHAIYRLLNRGLGLHLKPIIGYDSAPIVGLAVSRGEIDGMCTSRAALKSLQHVLDDGSAELVLYMGPYRRDDIDAPFLLDLEMSEDQRTFLETALSNISFGRPLALHPDADPKFVDAVRTAFKATVEDPEFLKEAAAMDIDIRYRSGEKITEEVIDLYQTPDALISEIAELVYGQK